MKAIPFPPHVTLKSPLSAAVEVDGAIYFSGVTAIDYATGEVVKADIAEQTRRVFESLKSFLAHAGLSLDRVVRVHVFLTSQQDVATMNTIYREYFKEPFPARSTVIAAALARPGLDIEIDVIAVR